MTLDIKCPKCGSFHHVKSGVISGRQRYRCKDCLYYYSVNKIVGRHSSATVILTNRV